ncbi:MAG: archaetidylserine decarboxylase [bacterium]
MSYLKKVFLFLISLPFFSRTWGAIAKITKPRWLVKKIILFYQKRYNIDLSFYEKEIEDYLSLSDFFVRKLNPDTRPLTNKKEMFLSPSDGKITVFETINADIATQVKGKNYPVSELIRKEIDFSDGYYLVTIYLSPKDYHRYHVPVDSTVKSYIHTGWRLFPVNGFGVNTIDKLFIRNERVVVKMEHRGFDYFYVAVGASFVGSLKMDFFEKPVDGEWRFVGKKYEQNQELGMFEMGSTIVLVIPEKMVKEPLVAEGESVQTGQPIFLLEEE